MTEINDDLGIFKSNVITFETIIEEEVKRNRKIEQNFELLLKEIIGKVSDQRQAELKAVIFSF
jgi:hypothetical protein